MGKKIMDEVISRAKHSKYYSILDFTLDESHVGQLTVMLWYIENDDPAERFVTFVANKGHKAREMFIALMELPNLQHFDLRDCSGQSYDNASFCIV